MARRPSTLDIGNHHFASSARAQLAATLAQLTPGELTYTVSPPAAARRSTSRSRPHAGRPGGGESSPWRPATTDAQGSRALPARIGGAAYFLSDLPEQFTKVPFADLDAIAAELARGDVAAVLLETVPATYGFPVPPEAIYLRSSHCASITTRSTSPMRFRQARSHRPAVGGRELRRGPGHPGHRQGPLRRHVSDRGRGHDPRAGQWLHENGWGHVSTFGGARSAAGSPGACWKSPRAPRSAAGLDLIERIGGGLRSCGRQPYLVEVRQSGLVIGLRVDHPDGAIYLQQELFELGVWAIASGFDQSVLSSSPACCSTISSRTRYSSASSRRSSTPRIDPPVPWPTRAGPTDRAMSATNRPARGGRGSAAAGLVADTIARFGLGMQRT